MRIINTFKDLDLLERLHPFCMHCEHKGYPLNETEIKKTYGEKVFIVDYLKRLKCVKCGSKRVQFILVSNMEMPRLDTSRQVYYSDDICGPYQIKNEPCVLPVGHTVLH